MTNAIEGLNRAIRKVIMCTLFPIKDAAKKPIYMAISNYMAVKERSTAMSLFEIMFGDRFTGSFD